MVKNRAVPQGAFVVIEGSDGAGKDTQIALLKQAYQKRDDVVFARDPGSSEVARAIRGLILAEFTEEPITPKAELLLFLAARAQLVEMCIAPALKRGKHVICQRFSLSTIAYQLYGREQTRYRDTFEELKTFVAGEWEPDCYIVLDVDVDVGIARTLGKEEARDRFERTGKAFYERVRHAYQREAARLPEATIVDANRSVETVFADVKAIVERHIR